MSPFIPYIMLSSCYRHLQYSFELCYLFGVYITDHPRKELNCKNGCSKIFSRAWLNAER